MTELTLSQMPLPIDKPISEWDALDHAIAAARVDEISAALAKRREREQRRTYYGPDGVLYTAPCVENLYLHH